MKFLKRGFTLIELLVVLSIIGLLATLSLASVRVTQSTSRDVRRMSDMREIGLALELYRNDLGGYPVVSSELKLGTTSAKVLSNNGLVGSAATTDTVYMANIPLPPNPGCSGNNDYTYNAYTDNSKSNTCTAVVDCGYYEIKFCLEKDNSTMVKGVHYSSSEGMK